MVKSVSEFPNIQCAVCVYSLKEFNSQAYVTLNISLCTILADCSTSSNMI